MDKDLDLIQEMQESNKQESRRKTQCDQYWQQLERRCGYGE